MEENPNYDAGTETALDRIRASFFDESDEPDEKLSAAEFDQKCQLVFAHANLTEGKSLEKTVKLLVARYHISRATGYRRCRDATTVFADVTRTHKEGIKHILYEMSMNVYRRALKAQDKFGNPDLKAANGAIKNMALLKGLDKDDSNALTPEMLGQKNYYLTMNIGGGTGAPKAIDMTNPDRLDADTYARVMEAVEGSDFSLVDMQLLLTEATEVGEEEGDD
ncbi:hypothetical protein [Hymenobacter terricola]|uniref:hypothetical protein n=1 Tax=Hymenobacter terricola TaxID=2819236 RepID=UPI001B310F77|nr:hypothetical protein [Hymenobacter terricola]